jgi:cytochrome c556
MMNKAATILGRTALVAGAATLVACGGPAYDPESPEGQAFEMRHEIMEEAGEKMQFINNMAREQIPVDEAAFTTAAVELAELTTRMAEGFDIVSPLDGSRSDPAIWENKADFDTKMEASVAATAALADAAQNSGFATAQALVVGNPTTSSTCSGCHNTYRLPEED